MAEKARTQDIVVVSTTISGIDYKALTANEALKTDFVMAMKPVFAKAQSVENNAVSIILAAGSVKVDATIVGTFKDTDVKTPDTDSVAASIKTCYGILDVLEPGLSLADITASPPTAVLLPAGSNEGTSVDDGISMMQTVA